MDASIFFKKKKAILCLQSLHFHKKPSKREIFSFNEILSSNIFIICVAPRELFQIHDHDSFTHPPSGTFIVQGLHLKSVIHFKLIFIYVQSLSIIGCFFLYRYPIDPMSLFLNVSFFHRIVGFFCCKSIDHMHLRPFLDFTLCYASPDTNSILS